ncbi:hypothetical protein D9M70_569400 [compost metagenome]
MLVRVDAGETCGAIFGQPFRFLSRIGVVIPGRGGNPSTIFFLVDEIHFGKQVNPIGDDVAAVEHIVANLLSVTPRQGSLLLLGAHAQVIAKGIVPTQFDIWITEIDRHRSDCAGSTYCSNSNGQTGETATTRLMELFHLIASLFIVF